MVTSSSTISTLPTQEVARGFFYHEWSQLSAAQKQHIYRERDCTYTVCTVASIMQEQETMNQNNDTNSQVHAGQVRGVTQASLDNISDAMPRRRTVGAFYTNFTTVCHPNVNCDFNISALS
jgi:hypothetical protein